MKKSNNFKIIDLFCGLGGLRLGFEKYGCKTVFSSDIDKYSQEIYELNFKEKPYGDINKINVKDIPNHDILLAGFPCQAFSIAGKGLGFADTRGTLFFNIEKILKEKKPKAFLLENVKRLKTHDNGKTFEIIKKKLINLKYNIFYKVLNTLDFGLPQKRERTYIVGFKEKTSFQFPDGNISFKNLGEILEKNEDVDKSYFLSNKVLMKRRKKNNKKKNLNLFNERKIVHENIGGNLSALNYSCALRAGGSYNYLAVDGIRRLTGREMLRLQGFPENYNIDLPYTQIRKLAGNSVSIPVIEKIAEKMLDCMHGK